MIVTDFHTTDTVVGITVSVDTIVIKMGKDAVKNPYMRGEHILATGTVLVWRANQIAVHGDYFQGVVNLAL